MKIAYTTSTQEPDWKNIPNIKYNMDNKSTCLHANCPSCGGTGIKKNGMGICVHGISCPCPKCSPRC